MKKRILNERTRTNGARVIVHEVNAGPLETTARAAEVSDELFEELVRELEEKLRRGDDPAAGYTPYLRAVHSSSRGYAQRVPGVVTGRLQDFLSRHEFHADLLFDWNRHRFTNIREQFGFPLPLTLEIARRENIRHPWNRFEKRPATMSVDFMLTERGGGWMAVDFKEKKDAAKKRTQEKLRLAGRTLATVGVPHFVMTEDDIPATVIRNYRWLRIHQLRFDPPPLAECEINLVEPLLRRRLSDGRTSIFDAVRQVSQCVGMDASKLARTCYWLVANRRWRVNLRELVGPDYPLQFIDLP
jgi:hypothetical protein